MNDRFFLHKLLILKSILKLQTTYETLDNHCVENQHHFLNLHNSMTS